MCHIIPVAIAAATAAAGLGLDQAVSSNKQLEYNAKTNFNNARLKLQEASYARQQSERNAVENSKQAAALIGRQRALMGASGAVVDSGSFMDVTLDAAEHGARDSMALLQQGDLESWRYRQEAALYEQQGNMALRSRQSGFSMFGNALLTGGTTFLGTYGALGGFESGAAASTNDNHLLRTLPIK